MLRREVLRREACETLPSNAIFYNIRTGILRWSSSEGFDRLLCERLDATLGEYVSAAQEALTAPAAPGTPAKPRAMNRPPDVWAGSH